MVKFFFSHEKQTALCYFKSVHVYALSRGEWKWSINPAQITRESTGLGFIFKFLSLEIEGCAL